MKKILFVINDMNIGGPQKSLLGLLDNIDYSMFDVSVLALKPDGILQKYYNKNVKMLQAHPLITAATLPISNTLKHLLVFLRYKKFKLFFGAIWTIIKYYVFKNNMNQGRQEFWLKYHNQLPTLDDEFDISFGVMAGLTTYFVVDCVKSSYKYHWIRSDYRVLKLNKTIENLYFQKVDGALAVSDQCAKIFIEEFSFMNHKVKVFYNLIPLNYYRRLAFDDTLMPVSNKQFNLLTVCRLDPLKGIEMAIDACDILVKRGVNIKWYILGGGKEKKAIEAIIQKKDLKDNFILLGFQLNTLAFIERCDIFVHPSRTEGKSNAVDEAKYMGKPIVVTNYETVSEQVTDGKTGIICGMNGNEIADSIEKLIADVELRKYLSQNCKNHLDNNYSITNYFYDLCDSDKENIYPDSNKIGIYEEDC